MLEKDLISPKKKIKKKEQNPFLYNVGVAFGEPSLSIPSTTRIHLDTPTLRKQLGEGTILTVAPGL